MAAPTASPELEQELRDAGMTAEAIEQLTGQMAPGDDGRVCKIRPDCWEIVLAWQLVSTQWRVAGRGGMQGGLVWIGLDYGAVAAVLTGMGVPQTPDLWWGLRVMEAEAKRELNT